MKHDQTPGFQKFKFGSDRESKMAVLQKIYKKKTKRNKKKKKTINLSPEPLGIIGYKFAWDSSGTLVF